MKKSDDERFVNGASLRQEMAELFTDKADDKAKNAYELKLARDKQLFELNNGGVTSVFNEQEKLRKLIEDLPQNYDPRFANYLVVFCKLMQWPEDVVKTYRKPPPTAQTITEVIYDRFPKNVRDHIYEKNPYIKWCRRGNKFYKFLGEDGIRVLEQFIDDAIDVMQKSNNLYDFRMQHALKFGSGFQPELFDQYIG